MMWQVHLPRNWRKDLHPGSDSGLLLFDRKKSFWPGRISWWVYPFLCVKNGFLFSEIGALWAAIANYGFLRCFSICPPGDIYKAHPHQFYCFQGSETRQRSNGLLLGGVNVGNCPREEILTIFYFFPQALYNTYGLIKYTVATFVYTFSCKPCSLFSKM